MRVFVGGVGVVVVGERLYTGSPSPVQSELLLSRVCVCVCVCVCVLCKYMRVFVVVGVGERLYTGSPSPAQSELHVCVCVLSVSICEYL